MLLKTSFSDFSNPFPPTPCGFDNPNGEDMFCCKDLDENSQRIKNPQPPRFKDKKSGKAYPCVDQTSRCRQWANITNSCSSDQELNPYYHFMREVCQASCSKKEKKNFRSNKCAKVNLKSYTDHSASLMFLTWT